MDRSQIFNRVTGIRHGVQQTASDRVGGAETQPEIPQARGRPAGAAPSRSDVAALAVETMVALSVRYVAGRVCSAGHDLLLAGVNVQWTIADPMARGSTRFIALGKGYQITMAVS